MRHSKKFNHLKRKAGHRRALLANMASALIEHKRINTTLAKAKALRQYIEPLVTKAKTNTTHSRRVVFSYLKNKEAIKELFGPVAEKVGDRPGGYVRVIRTGFRPSDGAEMAMIEFVDFNDVYDSKERVGGGGRRRRRRRGEGAAARSAAAAEQTKGASEEE
jgi:large subunit ribosomal protein L17